MSVVDGVSLAQTGIRATSLTTLVTIDTSSLSLPTFDPMSGRSMCGHDRLSSSASHPCSSHASASSCQCRNSVSLPEPAMIDETTKCCGNAFCIRPRRGTHQSSVLSEISSQFHDEWSAAPGRLRIESWAESVSARMNFVFGPSTLTTGCSPIVFVTTPPHPASNARMMFDSDSVGGADERRNGFSNEMPVKTVLRSTIRPPETGTSGHRDIGARPGGYYGNGCLLGVNG